MNATPAPRLVQQWHVATDASGAHLLLARWVSDSERSDAAGVA
jgi:hypothetical protein